MTQTHTHTHTHTHESHPAIIKRLRRAGGHLNSTIDMVVQGRNCLDIAQQLQAVEKAIQQAKKALIQEHLDHCLEDLVGPLGAGQRKAMDEFREITRYL
ncbi:MAG: metal-sensing transcriptional repressor [Acidovorax defluvii]